MSVVNLVLFLDIVIDGLFVEVAESSSVDSETAILLLLLVDIQFGLVEADGGLAVDSTLVPHLEQTILFFMSYVRIFLR